MPGLEIPNLQTSGCSSSHLHSGTKDALISGIPLHIDSIFSCLFD